VETGVMMGLAGMEELKHRVTPRAILIKEYEVKEGLLGKVNVGYEFTISNLILCN
jgi:hypothetical protein